MSLVVHISRYRRSVNFRPRGNNNRSLYVSTGGKIRELVVVFDGSFVHFSLLADAFTCPPRL